ncbi:hypothetical protein E2C01_094993 [Portunus trituberculatus]|uniref:Uncharacterized protein n=1 Tax=Portunus trituberculatus TaxID=210409 RepID=A0A5B7JRZ0_PORTR|nr:hypothetical protein [Portunus trituberculatus]
MRIVVLQWEKEEEVEKGRKWVAVEVVAAWLAPRRREEEGGQQRQRGPNCYEALDILYAATGPRLPPIPPTLCQTCSEPQCGSSRCEQRSSLPTLNCPPPGTRYSCG